MSTKSSSALVIAWNWIIQSLAKFKHVDSSTLIGLVKKATAISDDLGIETREMVSLRVLEGLFIRGNETIDDYESSQNDKISFDPSENCENVLHKILEETSEPVTELALQRWNVVPFIMHKRSSLPKSPLHKFKEAILEENHPLLASLKEKSKLGVGNTSENAKPVVDVNFDPLTTVAEDSLVSPDPENGSSPSHESNHEENLNSIRENCGGKEHEMCVDPPLKDLDENTFLDHVNHTEEPGQQVRRVSNDSLENIDFEEFRDPKNHIQPHVLNGELSGEGENGIENGNQLETDADNEISDDERSDFAAKKEAFFNSQFTLSQDSTGINDSTEKCVCVKCKLGDHLLTCSTDACQIKVHESCLTSAATYDENANFMCPFCAYARAIFKYKEAKTKTSLARKDLQAFISSQKRDSVRNEANSVAAEPWRLHDNNELHNVDKGVTVSNQKSTETRDVGEKVGEKASRSSTRVSTRRKYKEKESHEPAVSSHSRRCNKRKPQYTYPAIPLVGRKILMWTKPEEEMLKEGVRRFASVNNKMPWKEILEFGRGVFEKSRTTIDLKDKWRNMCKAAAKKQKL